MIVADTSAIIALIDRDDRHHDSLRRLFERSSRDWILPWAILPEVDYILSTRLGSNVARCFIADVADGLFAVEWDGSADLPRARELNDRYDPLRLGLVDTMVMAMAERIGARAIATLDRRDFGAVALNGDIEILGAE